MNTQKIQALKEEIKRVKLKTANSEDEYSHLCMEHFELKAKLSQAQEDKIEFDIKIDDAFKKLKIEPENIANNAQKFLIEMGCGDLVLNDSSPKDKWIYASDIMILFLRWKVTKIQEEIK